MKFSEGHNDPGGSKVKVMARFAEEPTGILSWKPVSRFPSGAEIEISDKELARYERYRKERDYWNDLIWERCAKAAGAAA